MAALPNNSTYILKDDIIEVLHRHIHRFDWRGEQCALDVSCGLGEVTQTILLPLLPKQATLIGFDESKEMIDYCNKFRIHERLSFNQIDIQYVDLFFNWKWDYFHKIFSFYCIRWMQNCRRSLCNMYSLLKNNGDILLMFLTPDNPMYRAFETLKERPSWQRLFSNVTWFYEARDPLIYVRRMLDEIGFKDIYCYQKLTSNVYPSWATYLDLIKAVNPYLHGLSEDQVTEGMESIREILKEDGQISENGTTGEITVHYGLVIAVAKKIAKTEK